MHNFHRFVGKLVCFDHTYKGLFSIGPDQESPQWLTVLANHLYYETTFRTIWLFLNMAFAAFCGCIFVSNVAQAAFEYGEKSLAILNIMCAKISLSQLYLIVQLTCKAWFGTFGSLPDSGLSDIEIVFIKENRSVKGERSVCRFGGIQGCEHQLGTHFVSCANLPYIMKPYAALYLCELQVRPPH